MGTPNTTVPPQKGVVARPPLTEDISCQLLILVISHPWKPCPNSPGDLSTEQESWPVWAVCQLSEWPFFFFRFFFLSRRRPWPGPGGAVTLSLALREGEGRKRIKWRGGRRRRERNWQALKLTFNEGRGKEDVLSIVACGFGIFSGTSTALLLEWRSQRGRQLQLLFRLGRASLRLAQAASLCAPICLHADLFFS